MLLKVYLIICVTIISARSVDYGHIDPIFSNIQSKSSESVKQKPDNESWNVHSNNIECNPLNISHICNMKQKKHNVLKSNTMNDNEGEGHSSETEFTNIRLDDQNIKYVKKVSNYEAANTAFIQENINYDTIEPFTNKPRQDNDDILSSIEAQTRKSTGPKQPTTIHGSKGLPHTTDAGPHQDPGIEQKMNFHENTLSDKVKTTTAIDDLEDRVTFQGDGCASGFVKVNGKCVKKQE